MEQNSVMTGLVSGEGVAIELSRAGLGSRVVAAFVDFGVQLVALFALFIADGFIGASDPAIAVVLVLVELVLVLAAYPIVFEWLGHGRTLGKMALGLRVVRDDGGPIGFRQALVRGLSGFLLEKPGIFLPPLCTAAGMLTLGASKSSKRIGDMMAGTFVVNERAGPKSSLTRVPLFVPPSLYGWAQSLDLSGIDDQFALQLRQFVMRAADMTPPARDALGAQFAHRTLASISPPPPAGVPTAVLLVTVLAERRRRADLTALPANSYAPANHPAANYQPVAGGNYANYPTPTADAYQPTANPLDAQNPFTRPM